MVRPAHRFAVNIVRDEPSLRPYRSARWSSLPVLIGLAAVIGAGVGGMLPAGRDPAPRLAAVGPGELAPARIEPAAGPAAALLGPQAPDRSYYAPVLLDSVPVTMRLEPSASQTLLTPGDAGRLSVGGAAGPVVEVEELALGGSRLGPVRLGVGPGDAPASVLGSDILDRLAIVAVEQGRLRLSPR